MRNKFIIFVLFCFICSCSKDLPKDPLTIPPNFAQLPTDKDIDSDMLSKKSSDKESDKDIKELKDLLLD